MAIIKKLYTSGRTADSDVNGNVSRRFAWAAVKQKILQRKTMWENMNGLNTNVKLHSSCSSTVFLGGDYAQLCSVNLFFFLLQIPGALHKVVSDKLACLVQGKQPDVTGKWLLITFGK